MAAGNRKEDKNQIRYMSTMEGKSEMSHVVERNIDVLLKRKKLEDRKKTTEEKIADAITCFTGSMLFVYLHLGIFGAWILWNSGLFPVKAFDPSYVILAMFASVEAIFLSTFVLISQNRMNIQADKRAELDLQVSLLAEHEITRLITLVSAMAKKMNIEDANDAEIEELSQDVYPEKVIETMEKVTDEKNQEE